MFAQWCRALRAIHLFPDQIRRLRLWEVGVLLDGDLADPAPRLVIPEHQAVADAPTGPRLREVD